ncbi:hypothetical protein B484DRAFT_32866, partial [Ochromonadaceae sp. CCMP2298]
FAFCQPADSGGETRVRARLLGEEEIAASDRGATRQRIAMLRRICTLALALVALMAFSVDAFRTSHTRNWRTSLLLMNPIEKLAAVNAELLAKKEGAELVGVKTGGVQPMTRCPKKLIDSKPATVAALLQREGCLSVPGVLSGATADALLAWVNGENERAKREVEAGEVLFDYRFGGVNCRGLNGMFGRCCAVCCIPLLAVRLVILLCIALCHIGKTAFISLSSGFWLLALVIYTCPAFLSLLLSYIFPL